MLHARRPHERARRLSDLVLGNDDAVVMHKPAADKPPEGLAPPVHSACRVTARGDAYRVRFELPLLESAATLDAVVTDEHVVVSSHAYLTCTVSLPTDLPLDIQAAAAKFRKNTRILCVDIPLVRCDPRDTERSQPEQEQVPPAPAAGSDPPRLYAWQQKLALEPQAAPVRPPTLKLPRHARGTNGARSRTFENGLEVFTDVDLTCSDTGGDVRCCTLIPPYPRPTYQRSTMVCRAGCC